MTIWLYVAGGITGGLVLWAWATLKLAEPPQTPEERAHDAGTEQWLAEMEQPPELHHTRFAPPPGYVGLGDPWQLAERPVTAPAQDPQTPGQPGRGGQQAPGAANQDAMSPGRATSIPALAAPGLTLASTSLAIPEPPGAADSQGGPDAAPGPGLPENVTAAFEPLRATLGQLSQADDDAERWPELVAGQGYSDETGSFAAICLDGE